MGASSLTSAISYVTAGNFTYDDSLVEFTGVLARLRDLREELGDGNATFHAGFGSNANGNWGDGVLTESSATTPPVASGMLDLRGSLTDYAQWAALDNADHVGALTLCVDIKPNYTGSPGALQSFIMVNKTGTVVNNLIQIAHATNGNIVVHMYGDNGVGANHTIAAWSPTAGVTYNFELNVDNVGGTCRLFINGTQHGSNFTSTVSRSAGNINVLRVGRGSGVLGEGNPNFEADNVVVYDTVQHTSAFTPVASIPATVYSIANPKVVQNASVLQDAVESFSASTSVAGADLVKYTLEVDDQEYYWTGSAWAESDGTYSQSNTAAEISANAATFDVPGQLSIVAYLHSAAGDTRPSLTSVTLGYNFYAVVAEPATCLIYGWLKDVRGIGISGATVTFKLSRSVAGVYMEASGVVVDKEYAVETDEDGYFEADLVRSSAFEGASGGWYEVAFSGEGISVDKSAMNTPIKFQVPDLASRELSALLTAA